MMNQNLRSISKKQKVRGLLIFNNKFHFLKYGILNLLLLLSTEASHAQIRSLLKNIDEFEIQFGPGLVSLYNENITKDIRQLKIGYTAKLGLVHSFSKVLSLNTEFLYQRKGLKTKYQVSYYDPSIDINNCKCTTSLGIVETYSNLDYLTFAPLLRYNPKRPNINFEIGPFASYLLKSKAYTRHVWDGSINYQNNKDNLKNLDAGFTLSISYQFLIKESINLNIMISDNYGMLNIGNTTIIDVITKTNSLSLLVGIAIKQNSNQN